MVVTQSHSTQDAHDAAGRKAQNLKLSFFQQNGTDNWEDITRKSSHSTIPPTRCVMQPWTLPTTLCFPATDQEGLEAWTLALCLEWATFDPPVNLGADYNTVDNDLFPFFNHNNQLHFSSNGHGGYGGLDVLREHIDGAGLEILGRPVNSTSDDFAIHLDSQGKGFISSNREGDTDHIYEIELEEVEARWVIALKNCSDDPVVGLSIQLMDSQGLLVESINSDSAGIVRFSGGTNTRHQLVFEGSPRHRASKSTFPPRAKAHGHVCTKWIWPPTKMNSWCCFQKACPRPCPCRFNSNTPLRTASGPSRDRPRRLLPLDKRSVLVVRFPEITLWGTRPPPSPCPRGWPVAFPRKTPWSSRAWSTSIWT